MRHYLIVFLLLALVPGIVSCDSVRKTMSGSKKAPDEFVVYKRPPLTLPPEFTLRPPMPGAAKEQKVSPREEAKKAVLSATVSHTQHRNQISTGTTAGIAALLGHTGALNAEPGIRAKVNSEMTNIAIEDRRFIDKLIFWVDDSPYEGRIVDPKKEQQRIMQNEALGRPITEGEVPEVKRRTSRKGLLDF